jgi:hypothetical protein
VKDVIEQYLLYLRGLGPELDTSDLPSDEREHLKELFEIVDALADRDQALPPLERDPVAIRLGIARA